MFEAIYCELKAFTVSLSGPLVSISSDLLTSIRKKKCEENVSYACVRGLWDCLNAQVAGSFWSLLPYIPDLTFWEMSLLIGIPQKELRFKLMSQESLRSSICTDSQTPLTKKTLVKNIYLALSKHTENVSPAKINQLTSLKANILVATCSTLRPNARELCDKHSIEVALL